MNRWLTLTLVLACLLGGVSILFAQAELPEEINAALQILSAELDEDVVLANLDAYTWGEEVYLDTSIGCPEPNVTYEETVTRAYHFLLTYRAVVYDIRVVNGGAEGRLCDIIEVTPTPPVTPPLSAQSISYENVSFELDPALEVGSVVPTTVPAVEPDESLPAFAIVPEHVHFELVDFMGAADPMFPAEIDVYPVAEYEGGGVDYVQESIDGLRALLEDRPDLSDLQDLPYLPLVNAAQILWAQAEYVEFDGGAGIRYLTVFRQGAFPVSNEDLLYIFQGMTDDGQYYVAASIPVDASVLPDSIDYREVASDFNPMTNAAEVTEDLNALASDDFTPSLDLLDNLFRSLTIS